MGVLVYNVKKEKKFWKDFVWLFLVVSYYSDV